MKRTACGPSTRKVVAVPGGIRTKSPTGEIGRLNRPLPRSKVAVVSCCSVMQTMRSGTGASDQSAASCSTEIMVVPSRPAALTSRTAGP